MRILPSQSSGMKRKVGSTSSLTTVEVEPVALGDRLPVGDARRRRAGRRRAARPAPRIASRSITVGEVVDVGGDVVAARVTRARRSSGTRRDAVEARLEQRVGLALDPAGDVGVGRAAVRRVVLEAAVLGRVVRRRDDDAVGERRAARRGCR